jgi:hypothetical protein
MIICPFCHFNNEDGALFCEQCKSDLAGAVPVAAAAAVAAVPVDAVPMVAEPVPAEPMLAVPVDAFPITAEPVHAEPMPLGANPFDFAGSPVVAEAVVAEPIHAEPVLAVPVQPMGEDSPPAIAEAPPPLPAAEAVPAMPLPEPVAEASRAPVNAIPAAAPVAHPALSATPAPPVAAPAGALAPGTQPRLLVLRGLKRNVEYPIYDGLNFIGRADDKPVDIDLEDQEPPDRIWCSRQHACISFENGQLEVEDLNSANGTYVNRQRIYPGQKRGLSVNDIVQIGNVQLKVIA